MHACMCLLFIFPSRKIVFSLLFLLPLFLFERWAFYKEVISFASLHQSFASMTDVIMLSNWPLFMDAAGDVGNVVTARIFFYSFKVMD